MKPPLRIGDIVTWREQQWRVAWRDGQTVTLERETTDSRGARWTLRRRARAQDCNVVGHQLRMDLP